MAKLRTGRDVHLPIKGADSAPVITSGLSRDEKLWREYQMSVDLYKFYIDMVIKMLVWYYAVTGGIISFHLTRTAPSFARWALVLPLIVSVALAALFVWGARRWQPVRNNAVALSELLKLTDYFELRALDLLLRGSAVLLTATGSVILYLLVRG